VGGLSFCAGHVAVHESALADNPPALAFVRYWSKSGHRSARALNGLVANDPTATLRVHCSSSVNAVPVGPMQRRMSAIGGKAHIAALSWSGHLVIDLDQKRQCKAELPRRGRPNAQSINKSRYHYAGASIKAMVISWRTLRLWRPSSLRQRRDGIF
jgi:hypothetical protein